MRYAHASRRRAAAVLLSALVSCAAAADEATPFRTLNSSPTVSIFGLPGWRTPPESTRVTLTTQLGNDFRFSEEGGDLLILDGETWRTGIALEHGFRGGWSAGVEIPYYRLSGGVLDDVIDGWHSTFGMPDGGRNGRPQDQFLFILAGASGQFLRVDRRAGGLGDAQVAVGRAFGATERGQFFVNAVLKLPTGDEDILAGSGSSDWALTLLSSHGLSWRGRPAGLFWGLGVTRLGEPERVHYAAKRTAYLAMVGGSLKPWPRTGLKLQLNANSPLYHSALKELGDTAVQASLGGWRELGPKGSLEFAINEDLNVGTAPDVALYLGFSWSF